MMNKQKDYGSAAFCLRYLMIIINIIYLLCGAALFGMGLYFQLERNFIAGILGPQLYTAACYILIVCGCILMLVSMLGFAAFVALKPGLIITYAGALSILALLLVAGIIVAGIFHMQIEERVRGDMEKNLQEGYGVDYGVTAAWNRTQDMLGCCAVRNNGWSIYRNTKWFREEGGVQGSSGKTLRRYVPIQCCKKTTSMNKEYIQTCTTKEDRPPGINSGPTNKALHYRGCWEATKEFVHRQGMYIVGFGVASVLLLIIGILASFALFTKVRKEPYDPAIMMGGRKM